MRPSIDDLITELERLRAEMHEIRRCQHARSGQLQGARLRAAAGFFAGALGAAALLTFAPPLYAQKGRPPGKSPTHMKVVAPFEVTDEKGAVIMRVTSAAGGNVRGLQMFNDGGKQVAVMNVLDGGAIVKLMRGGSGDYAVTLGATQATTGFLLREGGETPRVKLTAEQGAPIGLRVFNASGQLAALIGEPPGGVGQVSIYDAAGKQRVSIGAESGSGLGLRVRHASGQLAAIIGETSGGAGQVSIHDATGKQRAFVNGIHGTIAVKNSQGIPVAVLEVQKDMGVVQVQNGAGMPIAALTQGLRGAGIFQLYDAGGTTMVEAGTTGRGTGGVFTGPGSMAMMPGIPGSFIIGRR